MAVAKSDRVPMQVPVAFHRELKAEADRQGVTMTALLQCYRAAMIEAIKAQG